MVTRYDRYGSVEVEPAMMAQFENDIKSDIPIPLDRPTGYGLEYEKAKEYVAITLKNSLESLRAIGQQLRRDMGCTRAGSRAL